MGYAIGGLAGLVLLLATVIFLQTERIDALNVKNAELVVNVRDAETKSKQFAVETENTIRKITLDRNSKYETQIADLNVLIDKLRRERNSPSSTILPATSNQRATYLPAETDICFDKGELDAAQRDSEAEIEEILMQCTKTQITLQCAIEWIESLPRSSNYKEPGKPNVNIPSN